MSANVSANVTAIAGYAAQDIRVDEYMEAVALPLTTMRPLHVNSETGQFEECPIEYHTFPNWPTKSETLKLIEKLRPLVASHASIKPGMKSSAMAGPEGAGFYVVVTGDRGSIELRAGVIAYLLWRDAALTLLSVVEQLKGVGAH